MVNNKSFSFWPTICLICDQSCGALQLCPTCADQLQPPEHSCPLCALPRDLDSPAPCSRCQRHPPRYRQCIAATEYGPASARLVNRLKHQRQLPPAGAMAEALVQRVNSRYTHAAKEIDLLVPVPLSRKRLQWRGFNQAVEIARPLARKLALPLAVDACDRQHTETSQQTLDVSARQANLGNTFFVRKPALVAGRRIAIVDDVMTTGATANALCTILLEAGATHCDLWCFARTPRQQRTAASRRTRIET